MRKLTPAAALLVSAALASPAWAQITTAAASTGSGRPQPFSFTPSSFTYTVVDTSKATVPTTAGTSATTLGNSLVGRPVNVTGALQQSNATMALASRDPTRALQPRQPTNMFQIPNVFSRISSVNLVPSFFRARTTTNVFPNPGPPKQ